MSLVTLYHKYSSGGRSFDAAFAARLTNEGWVDSPDKLVSAFEAVPETTLESIQEDTEEKVVIESKEKSCPKCGKSFARGLTMHMKYCKSETE